MRWINAAIASALLVSCATETRIQDGLERDQANMTSIMEADATEATQKGRTSTLREVRYPPGGEWLAEEAAIGLRQADAQTAIRALAAGRPVVFEFEYAANNPIVENSRVAITVQDHLDAVTAQADWAWTYEAGVIVVRDVVTETVAVRVTPGERVFSVSINSLNNAGAADGATNNLFGTADPYLALGTALEAVGFVEAGEGAPAVGEAPGTYAVLEYAGSVVLQGRPGAVSQARKVIERFNSGHLARAVVEVTVYEVEFSEGSDRRLDIDLLRSAATEVGLAVQSVGGLNNVGSAGLRLTNSRPGDRLMGSEATLRWLTQHGTTSVSLNRRVELVNNEWSTIRDIEVIPYVREVTLTSQALGVTVSTTPSVQIDETNVGFVLSILPTVEPALGVVSLRMNLSRAVLVDNLEYDFGDGQIVGIVPVISQKDDVVTISLADGEAIIASSATLTDRRRNSVETPFLPRVGDAVTSSENRTEFVLLVSAAVGD